MHKFFLSFVGLVMSLKVMGATSSYTEGGADDGPHPSHAVESSFGYVVDEDGHAVDDRGFRLVPRHLQARHVPYFIIRDQKGCLVARVLGTVHTLSPHVVPDVILREMQKSSKVFVETVHSYSNKEIKAAEEAYLRREVQKYIIDSALLKDAFAGELELSEIHEGTREEVLALLDLDFGADAPVKGVVPPEEVERNFRRRGAWFNFSGVGTFVDYAAGFCEALGINPSKIHPRFFQWLLHVKSRGFYDSGTRLTKDMDGFFGEGGGASSLDKREVWMPLPLPDLQDWDLSKEGIQITAQAVLSFGRIAETEILKAPTKKAYVDSPIPYGIPPEAYSDYKETIEKSIARNNLWVQKLLAFFEDGAEVVSIAVGRAHLQGPEGILTLLMKAGYQIQWGQLTDEGLLIYEDLGPDFFGVSAEQIDYALPPSTFLDAAFLVATDFPALPFYKHVGVSAA